MTTPIDLKDIERRAYRSTYQDGLWDIYTGLIVIFLSFFMSRPEVGYGPFNLLWLAGSFALAYLLYRAGKRFITRPRLGQVKFGPARKRRARTLAIVLGFIILLQAGIVGLTALAWANPGPLAPFSALLGGSSENLLVAAVGALFVGPSLALMAWFNDFRRGYFIAIVMSLAVFLMIRLNQPLYPMLLGLLILLPGVLLLLRFIRKYPLSRPEAPHE